MTTETTMTDAATTTEGSAASGEAATQPATGAGDGGQQQQQASAGQEGQSTEGQAGGEQQKPEGAPETYAFKAAEGVTYDDAVIGAFSEAARELNLTQDAAQKVLDKVAPVMAARHAEQAEAQRTAWADKAKGDKEFGGDKWAENLAFAKKSLDTFGTPELRALLNESGLGNHPEVIRVFYRAGKAISEDRIVTGAQGGPGAETDAAKRLFPNQA